jgi:predicted Zn-dependent protease with MMP-like domain
MGGPDWRAGREGRKMERERFVRLVEEALDGLPGRFRKRIQNLAVLVEDRPAKVPSGKGARNDADDLVTGIYQGVPATEASVWDLPAGPNVIVLYQKNIEALCSSEAEIRKEIRQTVLHELGHYFGMSEAELEDV